MKKNLILIFCALCLCQSSAFSDQPKEDCWKEAALKGDKNSHFKLASHFYYEEPTSYSKAMYWAFKGAEKGSSECMLLLRNAYGQGHGVIQDTEECLKWLLLSSAIGNKEAQNEVNELERTEILLLRFVPDSDIAAVRNKEEARWKEAKRRAKEWMSAHNELFFSMD